MNLSKKILTWLPDTLQNRIMHQIFTKGTWKKIPTFHMLFTSYEIMGADHDDLLAVFNNSHDMGLNFYENCRIVAQKRFALAQTSRTPIEDYQKSILLYFLADWVSDTEEMINHNYQDLLRTSKILEGFCSPKIEKVRLPWLKGEICMRFRIPQGCDPSHPKPLVILFQGNDTVKETLFFLENVLLEGGFAVLNVDQPGWGESRLTGNFFQSYSEMPKLASILYSYAESRPEVIPSRICVCGFSGGGTYAAMMASADNRFKCFISYGGGIYDLEKAIRGLPSLQKRQVMKHWGCTKVELNHLLQQMHFNQMLSSIHCQTLIIHGEQDTLIPIGDIKKAVKLIPGQKEIHYVRGGDHMCSATLMSIEIPFIVAWLKRTL